MTSTSPQPIGLTVAEALALTTDDIESMSTQDLLRVLEVLLGFLPLTALERIERRVFSSHDRRA